MDKDRIVGEAKKAGGKIEEAAGRALGRESLEAEGLVDQAKGAVQNAYGRVKDTARDYVGDTDELVGRARDVASRAAEEGRRYLDAGRDYIDEGWDQLPEARAALGDGRDAIVRRVQETPLAALLIAGAIGYGLALLLHRTADAPPARPTRRRPRRRED